MSQLAATNSIARAREVTNWQDYFVLLFITFTYATGGGFTYCVGLLQASWISDGLITSNEASLINSVSFAFLLVPFPFVEMIVHRFDLSPNVLFACAVPLTGGGLLLSWQADTYLELLIANGVLVSLSVVFIILGCWKTLYLVFTDDQIYLYNCVMVSGLGIGMMLISGLFYWFQETLGWRGIQKIELLFNLLFVLDAVLFIPSVARSLGIRTRREKTSGFTETTPLNTGAPTTHQEDVTQSLIANQQYSESFTLEGSSLKVVIKSILTNVRYLLVFLSWSLSNPVFNTILVHQPSRMVSLHFSVQNGAWSLVCNGLIQIFVRLGVGFVTSYGIISPVRLSQVAKFGLAVSTVLSNFLLTLPFQTAYMFLVGVAGGLINTTDFLLVKDSVKTARELAITNLFLADGLISLVLIAAVGFLSDYTGSYFVSFNVLAGMVTAGFFAAVVYEIQSRRTPTISTRK